MHLPIFLLLAISTALITCAPPPQSPTKRATTPDDILTSISHLNTTTTHLTHHVTHYNGTYNQTTTLLGSFNFLRTLIQTTTSEVSDVSSLDEDDSYAIADRLADLAPNFVTLILDLEDKESTIAADSQTGAIEGVLQGLNADFDALFTGLEEKAVENSFAAFSASQEEMGAVLGDGIARFAS